MFVAALADIRPLRSQQYYSHFGSMAPLNGSLNRLAWAALVIGEACAFLPTTSPHVVALSRSRRMLCGSCHHYCSGTSGTTARHGAAGGSRRGRAVAPVGSVVVLQAANRDEEVDADVLQELRRQKLAKWKAMHESGEVRREHVSSTDGYRRPQSKTVNIMMWTRAGIVYCVVGRAANNDKGLRSSQRGPMSKQ